MLKVFFFFKKKNSGQFLNRGHVLNRLASNDRVATWLHNMKNALCTITSALFLGERMKNRHKLITQVWFLWQHLKAAQPHLPPELEVIRRGCCSCSWTIPPSFGHSLRPPARPPGGPCALKSIPSSNSEVLRFGWEPRPAEAHPAAAHTTSTQRRTSSWGAAPRSENLLRDPTFFVRRICFERGGLRVAREQL